MCMSVWPLLALLGLIFALIYSGLNETMSLTFGEENGRGQDAASGKS